MIQKQLNKILEILDLGDRSMKEIREHLGVSINTARKYVNLLIKEKKVVRAGSGRYDLHENYKPLTPLENRKIIKDLILFQRDTLSIYRKRLNILLDQEPPDPGETQKLLDCIRTLALSIDRLLKRWNVLTQGYDSNTQQASEDAKQKTSDREKQELEHLPPEDQLEVVGDYDVEMRVLLESLPEQIEKKATV